MVKNHSIYFNRTYCFKYIEIGLLVNDDFLFEFLKKNWAKSQTV